MMSHSSVQCQPSEVFGAESWTPPRLWVSSWAAMSGLQQLRSTRAQSGPTLFQFAVVLLSSP